MRQPMRSSIACQNCRRQKIKCDNDGGNSPCDSCIKTGKDCRYESGVNPQKRPGPAPNPAAGASADTPAVKQERESVGPIGSVSGPDRKRFKRIDEITRIESDRAPLFAEDALGPSFLTEELWDHLFNIYKLHFATELPFLHIPTLKERISIKLKAPKTDPDGATADTNLVLLGVLTLTARFHPGLVKYVANQVNPGAGSARSRPVHTKFEPIQASEYYANVLAQSLGPLKTGMTTASVERMQAFLMLGLYQWAQSQPETGSLGAWMYVGVAIRMAQALGLGFGDKPRPSGIRPRARGAGVGLPQPKAPAVSAEVAIEKEIRRRTMFSCLIMDRIMSSGKDRVSTIQSEDLQIQLPCSEDAFDLSKEVHTGFLRALPGPASERPITDDSVLSRFVKLIDIWGKISKFSFSGGRLNEQYPPWDPRTTFYKLTRELEQFYDDLLPTFRLSHSNYYRHENHHASSVYISLHMLGSLCSIMLHREYIPYIPIRCDRPVGPLDAPRFPADEFDIPPGFWDRSADKVFSSAKDIVDLIEMCQKRDNLPQSSLIGFSVWTTAFVGIYAYHFPHLDQKRRMIEGMETVSPDDVSKVGSTGVTYQALSKMAQYSHMATSYLRKFQYYNKYYAEVKLDHTRAPGGDHTRNNLSIRHGGEGGGLEEWRRDSVAITNHGNILPDPSVEQDPKMDPGEYQSNPSTSRASTADRGSSLGPEYLDRSGNVVRPRSTPGSNFLPINNMAGTPKPLVTVQQQQLKHMARNALGGPTGPWDPVHGEQRFTPTQPEPGMDIAMPLMDASTTQTMSWLEHEGGRFLDMSNELFCFLPVDVTGNKWTPEWDWIQNAVPDQIPQ